MHLIDKRRDPLTGTRESSFTSFDVSWPGNFVRLRSFAEPLPDRVVAQGLQISGVKIVAFATIFLR